MVGFVPRGLQLLGEILGWPTAEVADLEPLLRLAAAPAMSDPDAFYGMLQEGLSASRLRGTPPRVPRVGGRLVAPASGADMAAVLDRYNDNIAALWGAPDGELVEQARQRFSFGLGERIRSGLPFQYSKVNHGFWGKLAVCLGPDRHSFDQRLVWKWTKRHSLSGFLSYFFACSNIYFNALHASDRAEAIFGVAYDAGETTPEVCLACPLDRDIRDGLVGLLAYFREDFAAPASASPLELGLGSVPKSMIFDNTLGAFVDGAVEASEAVVFLVPTHLRQVMLARGSGRVDQYTVVLPEQKIHEFWEPVSASVAGWLEAILPRYRSVTIFTQSATLCFPLMLISRLVRDRCAPATELRYFDLGQAFDVAISGQAPTGPWLRLRSDLLAGLDNPFTIRAGAGHS